MFGWGTWRTEHGEGRVLDRLLSPLEKENIIIRSHSPCHGSVVGVHVRRNIKEVSPTRNQREYGRKRVKVASALGESRDSRNVPDVSRNEGCNDFFISLVGDMRHPATADARLGHVLDRIQGPRGSGLLFFMLFFVRAQPY